jgi:oxygen-dependent protoporphyrinogen oxidase
MNPAVVIVGGGIAGLAAAYRLAQRAPGLPVTVLESEVRLGGKLRTERVDGFVVEGGPDAFLASKPRGAGLARELGLGDRLQGLSPQAQRARVRHAGRLHALPEGLTGLVPRRMGPLLRSPLLSARGKVRLALEVLLPPSSPAGDETLARFIRRRLGPEAYDRLFEPLLSGIYAGDGERLSLAATFPQLQHLERAYGGLWRGALATRHTTAGQARSAFLTLPGGMGELVEALAARLSESGTRLVTGAHVTAVHREPAGHWLVETNRGERLDAPAVLVATPANRAGALLAAVDETLARRLSELEYVSPVTVSLAYRLADVPGSLAATGYVVPRAEGRPALACTFSSTKFAGRAPEGWALLRVYLGRAGERDMTSAADTALVQLAQAELRQTLGVQAEPLRQWVFRWRDGLPQYNLGHLERVAAVRRQLAAQPGLYLAGAAYQGVGIPDCITSGETAADQALAGLAIKESRLA